MTSDGRPADRKRLRIGQISERGAINAVRTLLESHGLVVDEVDGRSDYGRDLVVDITEGGEITGAVISVQVKGDRRFIRDGDWELPVTAKDRRYWAESSVPIFGILWDPGTGELRWSKLTAHARTTPSAGSGTSELVRLSSSRRLTDDSLSALLDEARDYLRRWSPAAMLGLFDSDDEWRCNAVYDCWTLGRSDARAFVLLRWALPGMSGASLRQAMSINASDIDCHRSPSRLSPAATATSAGFHTNPAR